MTERFGPRAVVTFGAAVLPVALFFISRAHSKWEFFISFGVFGSLGTSMLGTIPTFAALNHWFTTSKAQSFSWASAGLSSAGLVLVPLTQYLIGHYGWRMAYQINAALLVLTIYPLIGFLFYDRPHDLGVEEEVPPEPVLDAAPDRLLEYHEIVTDMRFMLTVASLALASACWSVILQSFVSDLSTRNTGFRWEPAAAASLFAFLAMLCGIGKPIFGAVGDRMERRRAIILAISMQFAGFLCMIGTRWTEIAPFEIGGVHTDLLLTAGIFLYGLGVGGCLPLFSAVHADQFGRLSFPRVSGLATPFNVGVVFCMYLVTGSIYDRYQSYLPQSWIFIGGYIVSLLCIVILMVRVKRPRNPRKTFDTPLEQAEPV